MRLQVVEMRAAAMDFRGDIVSGAMREPFPKSRLANHRPRGIVCLKSGNRPARRKGRLHHRDRRVASISHSLEDQLLAMRWFTPDHPRPGDVVEDRLRPIHPPPDIDQHKIPFADRLRRLFGRRVVRVGSIFVRRNIGAFSQINPARRIASESHCTIANSVAARRAAIRWPHTTPNLAKPLRQHIVDDPLRLIVAGDPLLAQHRLKVAHQIGRNSQSSCQTHAAARPSPHRPSRHT